VLRNLNGVLEHLLAALSEGSTSPHPSLQRELCSKIRNPSFHRRISFTFCFNSFVVGSLFSLLRPVCLLTTNTCFRTSSNSDKEIWSYSTGSVSSFRRDMTLQLHHITQMFILASKTRESKGVTLEFVTRTAQ